LFLIGLAWRFLRFLRRTGFLGPLTRLALDARLIAAWWRTKRRRLTARRLDAAERAAEFVNLALIRKLLALGDLDKFQDFIKLVNHLLERPGDFGGMRDGLADGRGFSRAKIGGFDPRLRAQWFRTAFRSTLTLWFTLRRGEIFSGSLRDRRLNRIGFGRGKIGGRFRVRLAKIAGRIRLVFDVFGRRCD
jgi:hypothetical protein